MRKIISLTIIFSFSLFIDISAQLTVRDHESTPNTLLQINDEGNGGSITIPSLSSIGTSTSKLYNIGGNLYWGLNQLGLAGSAGGWTDAGVKIYTSTSTDKVGIGTTNPQSFLSVGGDGTTQAAISGITSYETGRGVYGKASYTGWSTNYGGYFEAEGVLGYGVYSVGEIGVLGQGGSSGVSGKGSNYGGYFTASGTTGYGIWAETISTSGVNYGAHFSTASTDGRAVRGHATNTIGENYGGAFRADGDESRAVWAFGQAYDFYAAGPGTNYGASSSIRWKRNIVNIDNPMEKLLALRGVYFDWNEDHGGNHDIGCIAEEVGKVLPEIVVYEKNGIDANGMDYSKLTPLLIEAVKDQQKIINDLTTRLEKLENFLKMKFAGK